MKPNRRNYELNKRKYKMIEIDLTMTRNIPITKEINKGTRQYYIPTQYSSQKKSRMIFRFPSVICTLCTDFFSLAIIKRPPMIFILS